jgi:non-specific serine/threonine protein kinase
LAFADEAGLDPLKIAIEMVRARIEADTGDLESAARRLRNALELSRAIGVRHRTSDVFEDLANVSARRGAHETAVRLLGAAERFRESSGLVDPPLRQRELASIEAGAATAIGRDRVDAAWAQGRALSDDRAANYALLDDTSELDGIDPDQRPSDADPSEQAAFGTFVLEGDYWTIEHASSVVRIKDAVGMRYLAHLLTHPVNELHVFELVALLRGTFGSADASGEDLAIDAREGIDTIDANAREAYRARLDELRSDITEAEEWGDGERAARAKAEMDALVEQLASAFGIGGRARQTSSDANRARVAVTKALRTAIRRITETTPDLGEHLGRAVRTGVFCSYEADPLRPLVVR